MSGRSWRSGHVGWDDDDGAHGSGTDAFAAKFLFFTQGQMDNAAFAAGHGIEVEGHVGALHLFGSDDGAHAQVFDAQQTIVVGIEGDERMILGRKVHGLHREVLKREQEFASVGEKQFDIGSREVDGDFGVLYFGMRILR